MVQFSPVAPVKILQQLEARGALGNYLLLLCHDVIEHRSEYRKLINKLSTATLILDNSVIELGRPMETDTLAEAANWLEPTFVVLPDHLRDATSTIHAATDAASDWNIYMKPGIHFMAVPQGKTEKDILECANQLKDLRRVRAWGVPRLMANDFGTRRDIIRKLRDIAPDFAIHLLGFSEHMRDDLLCAREERRVIGIDSSVPFVLGQRNKPLILDGIQGYPSREGYIWEEVNEQEVTQQTLANLQLVRNWLT